MMTEQISKEDAKLLARLFHYLPYLVLLWVGCTIFVRFKTKDESEKNAAKKLQAQRSAEDLTLLNEFLKKEEPTLPNSPCSKS